MKSPVGLGFSCNQDKVCTPEETVRRFQQRLAEVDLDILKEVAVSTTAGWKSFCGMCPFSGPGHRFCPH